MFSHDDNDETYSWYWDYLVTPWCRAGAYIIGMVVGIILYRLRGKKVKMHWVSTDNHRQKSYIQTLVILVRCCYRITMQHIVNSRRVYLTSCSNQPIERYNTDSTVTTSYKQMYLPPH